MNEKASSTAFLEGNIEILMRQCGDAITAAHIRVRRPPHVGRLFAGHPPTYFLEALPLLYSICAMAHRHAALRACAAAQGIQVPVDLERALTLLVALETVREHLARIWLDWPRHVSETPAAAVSFLGKLVSGAWAALFPHGLFRAGEWSRDDLHVLVDRLETVVASEVFGEPGDVWVQRDAEDLLSWAREGKTGVARVLRHVLVAGWASAGDCEIHCLPPLAATEWADLLGNADGDAFAMQPTWQGLDRETTVLCRQASSRALQALRVSHGSGLLARQMALLLELAHETSRVRHLLAALPDTLPPYFPSAEHARDGVGVGKVEAARGRLVYYLVLAKGRVRQVRVVAPTEWNFHPRGVVSRGLACLVAGDEHALRTQAELFVGAVDPCVSCELRIQ